MFSRVLVSRVKAAPSAFSDPAVVLYFFSPFSATTWKPSDTKQRETTADCFLCLQKPTHDSVINSNPTRDKYYYLTVHTHNFTNIQLQVRLRKWTKKKSNKRGKVGIAGTLQARAGCFHTCFLLHSHTNVTSHTTSHMGVVKGVWNLGVGKTVKKLLPGLNIKPVKY